jgi:hypothetical protein
MSITLTTPYALPSSGTRLLITSVRVDDDQQQGFATIELRSAPGTDYVISSQAVVIRNGLSDRVRRNVSPPAGTRIDEALALEQSAVSTPTGYTDAVAAWRGGATPAARRSALEAVALAAGWIDASLTGT